MTDDYAQQWQRLSRHYRIARTVQIGFLPLFALLMLLDQRHGSSPGANLLHIEVGMVVAFVAAWTISAIRRPKCPRCARRFFGVRPFWRRNLAWNVKLSWGERWSWEQRLASLRCLHCGLRWGADSKGSR
jgi:hypothetical protein